jgi:hypothetical protein
MGNLAQLNALNSKKDRKSGWNTYDEAYLQEVRAKEKALEDKRQNVETVRGVKEEKKRRRQEDEAYQSAREQANLRARELREQSRKEGRTERPQAEMVEIAAVADVPTRRQQRYERLVGDHGKTDSDKSPNKKRRVVSGPYVEDGRAEEVYRRKKGKKRKNGGSPLLVKLRSRKMGCICKSLRKIWTWLTLQAS